jgi:methylated-DNA-[protein]-cysteine S-methyltransferase
MKYEKRVREKLELQRESLPTPVGTLWILTDARGVLRAVDWQDHEERMLRLLRRHYGGEGFAIRERGGAASAALSALEAYLAGDLRAIDDLPVETGGTPFQRSVWAALRAIPSGSTQSYGGLAARIGAQTAVRAVGAANGANPVGIVIPCHRVIGADASLTGYGGGLERKRWLLVHEGARPA